MKLLRYGHPGREKPGILDTDGKIRSLQGIIRDLDGSTIGDESLADLRGLDLKSLPRVEPSVRIGPPVASIGKLIGIGLNYSDHAAESNMPVPSEPIVFMKATSAIVGPNDDVELPAGAQQLDWEVELAFAIGRIAKNVPLENALDHVAGYLIVNDISERHWQAHRQGQWTKGKSHDTFAPMGPWLVTRDEFGDPQNVDLRLHVSGEKRQDGSTRTMIFGVAFLIHYVSQFMTLHPGDVVTTGTPPGVGQGRKPPQFLKAGDVMTLSIQGLGQQRQTVRSAGPKGSLGA